MPCSSQIFTLRSICLDQEIDHKDKINKVSSLLSTGELSLQNDFDEEILIIILEALESLSKNERDRCNNGYIDFCSLFINDKNQRVQWQAIRVITNLVNEDYDFEQIVEKLLVAARNQSELIRWTAAIAFGKILALPQYQNGLLYGQLLQIYHSERQKMVYREYQKILRLDEDRKIYKRKKNFIFTNKL